MNPYNEEISKNKKKRKKKKKKVTMLIADMSDYRTNLTTADSGSTMRSFTLPNIPVQPKNGMIRTYDNSSRTFTRPYSAKTVFFYKEGDEYFTGIRVPISKSRYRNMDSLLDELNQNIQMPFGVRRLTTPMGRTPIEDLDQLQHLGKYVASSSKYNRGINLSALERLTKARTEAHQSLRRENAGGQSYWVPTSPSYRQKLRLSRTLGLQSVPSKQVFFVLNGKGKFYRTLLNPMRLPSMEHLLREVSDGLEAAVYRFYSTEGVRVINVSDMLTLSPPKMIACQRNERPTLVDHVTLPLINPNRYAPKKAYKNDYSSTSTTNTTTTTATGSIKENGMEKPRGFESAVKRNTRRVTGVRRKKLSSRLPALPPSAFPSVRTDDSDSGKAESTSSNRTNNKIEEDESSADYPTHREEEEEERREEEREEERKEEREEEREEEVNSARISEDSLDGEAEKKAEMIRKESDIEENTESEDDQNDSEKEEALMRHAESRGFSSEEEIVAKPRSREDDDSDKEIELPSAHGRPSSSRKGTADSNREIELPSSHGRPPSSSNSHRKHLARKRTTETADSNREVELPSDEEEIERQTSSRKRRSRQNSSESNRSSHDGSAKSNRRKSKMERKETTESNRETILPSDIEEEADSNAEVELPSEDEGQKGKASRHSSIGREESERSNVTAEVTRKLTEDEAATIIQAAYRGYNTRKKLKKVNFMPLPTPPPASTVKTDSDLDDDVDTDEEVATVIDPNADMTYTIAIQTGHRWGADTEADLYITLIGEEETLTSTFQLKQDADNPRFLQNQSDSFHFKSKQLGILTKVIVGHNETAYGAGIFIDYILVTENVVEGRQFIFYCYKWLDSGQVDGKIERTLTVSAFYYVNSIPDEQLVSQGRWELVLHSGTPEGKGGTTSNLFFIGYGTTGSSMVHVSNDKTLLNVPSTTLIQVDFGNIGNLLKVRIETDGYGDSPNYFLEYVEMRDLDTEERLVVRVGKWLDLTGETKKRQPFRELSVFRSGESPLHMTTYEGRIQNGDHRLLQNSNLRGHLVGEYSDSGQFPLMYNDAKNDYTFKVDCTFLGRILSIRVIGDFTDQGEGIFEGMSVLQDIWDKHVGTISVADKLIAISGSVRESTHCPYRYTLTQGKVMELPDEGHYFKTIVVTGMEGLSTRNKKMELDAKEDDWTLEMSVEEVSAIPDVFLCKGRGSHKMQRQINDSEDVITFKLKCLSIGLIDKVRVSIGQMEHNEHLRIKKMHLWNSTNPIHIRYSSVHTHFLENQSLEYSAVYPDVPPKMNMTYAVSIQSVSGTAPPSIHVNVIGSDGESGARPVLSENEQLSTLDVEAVNLGEIIRLDVTVEDKLDTAWVIEASVNILESDRKFFTNTGTITQAGKTLQLDLLEES